MKKALVVILCILILLFSVLAAVAKSHTYGIHVGTEIDYGPRSVSALLPPKARKNLLGETRTYIYQNAFGMTVVAHQRVDVTERKITIDSIRTIPTTFVLTTHLDFIGLFFGQENLFDSIIANAGMPLDQKPPAHAILTDAPNFRFKTIDGYEYHILAPWLDVSDDGEYIGGGAYLWRIVTPDGRDIVYGEEMDTFQRNVILSYLALAAILAAFAAALLIFQKKRNKRLEKAASAE